MVRRSFRRRSKHERCYRRCYQDRQDWTSIWPWCNYLSFLHILNFSWFLVNGYWFRKAIWSIPCIWYIIWKLRLEMLFYGWMGVKILTRAKNIHQLFCHWIRLIWEHLLEFIYSFDLYCDRDLETAEISAFSLLAVAAIQWPLKYFGSLWTSLK